MKHHVNVHRLLCLMMLVSCFISLAVLFKIFFMVPSVSVLTEFHFLVKSNICQTVIQTSCESRTVSWKLTTKTDCDVQLRTQMLSIQCRLYTGLLAKCEGAIPHYRPKIALFRTIRFFPHFAALFAFIC